MQVVCSLVSISFYSPQLGMQSKQTVKPQTIDPKICSILCFRKVSGNSFSTRFCACFFKKNVFHVLLFDQIWLPDCIYILRYWAICVLELLASQLWHHKLKIFFNQAVFLENEKSFYGETKSIFYRF